MYTPKGESNGRAVLSADDVREMREAYAQGGATQRELAEQYGIDGSSISDIVRGETWQDAPGPLAR
jgi:hypothetical protein